MGKNVSNPPNFRHIEVVRKCHALAMRARAKT